MFVNQWSRKQVQYSGFDLKFIAIDNSMKLFYVIFWKLLIIRMFRNTMTMLNNPVKSLRMSLYSINVYF